VVPVALAAMMAKKGRLSMFRPGRHRVDLVDGGHQRSANVVRLTSPGQPVGGAVLGVIRYFMPMPSSNASSNLQ